MRRLLLITAFVFALHPMTAEPLPQPTPTLSIAHAAMRVSDLSRSREFYRKLGFEEAFVFEKNGLPTEVFLKVNDDQFIELYPRENNSQASGFMHVCFESSNLEGLNRLFESVMCRLLLCRVVVRGISCSQLTIHSSRLSNSRNTCPDPCTRMTVVNTLA